MKNRRKSIAPVLCAGLFCCVCFCTPAAKGDSGEPSGTVKVEGRGEEVLSLSLEECVRYAVYNSFEVKMARLDLLIAETERMYAEAVFDTVVYGNVEYSEDKRQQLSVFAPDDNQTNVYSAGVEKKLPTGTEITAEFSDTRSWSNSSFISRNPAHAAELTLEAKQPLGKNIFGYLDRGNLSVTKLAIRNAGLETKDRIEFLIAKVEKAYWELVFAGRSVEFHAGMLERARDLHEANTRNYDLGLIERGDLLASEANVLLRATDLRFTENEYRRAEEDLKLLMNMADDRRVSPAEDFPQSAAGYDLPDCLKEAFEKRRDYRIRKRDVEIRNITLKMKGNSMWPEIDLTASMISSGIDPKFPKAAGKTTVVDNTYYFAGVEVSMPLENSLARGEFEKARHEKEKAILAIKETERAIITEVGNSFRDVITFRKNAASVSEAVSLQREKLKEEEKRFRLGRSSTRSIIDYQEDLLNAERRADLARLRLEKSKTDLERNMNVLLEKYGEVS